MCRRSLGHIAVNMDQRVLVALALDPPFSLCQISGPPGAVQIMEGNKAVLHVGPGPHFLGAANKNADLPLAGFGEQLLFADFGIGFMDKSNLLRWDTANNQLLLDIIVDGKGWDCPICRWLPAAPAWMARLWVWRYRRKPAESVYLPVRPARIAGYFPHNG